MTDSYKLKFFTVAQNAEKISAYFLDGYYYHFADKKI
jgi:hypothetical protein